MKIQSGKIEGDVDSGASECGKLLLKSSKMWKKFQNPCKNLKKLLTHTGQYNIIFQCDVVRNYLYQSPGKGVLHYR